MDNKRKFLEKIYGYPFPESFFQFYEFTQNLPPNSITGLESTLSISLKEVFQIFDPDLDTNEFDPLKSSRYYNDPPEFFTIMRGHTDGLHWGYYLDDPKHPEKIFVAKFYANDAYTISHEGYSLFEAFRFELELIYEGVKTNLKDDPKSADIYLEQLNQIETIREILMNYATGNRQEIGWDYDDKYNIWLLKERINTREGLGIYVPPDLYRPLPGEDKFQIWNYQPTPEEVATLYTNAMKAMNDGFPGTALKAGKDLWIYHEYFDTTYKLLNAAYEALDRLLLCRTLKLAKEFREECDGGRQFTILAITDPENKSLTLSQSQTDSESFTVSFYKEKKASMKIQNFIKDFNIEKNENFDFTDWLLQHGFTQLDSSTSKWKSRFYFAACLDGDDFSYLILNYEYMDMEWLLSNTEFKNFPDFIVEYDKSINEKSDIITIIAATKIPESKTAAEILMGYVFDLWLKKME